LNIGRLLLPIILASCSSYAQAVLIEGRDWLQLSETTGFTWDEIDAIYDSSTGACDAASCTLSSTVDLAGYRWASNEEVDAMMSSFFAVSGLTHLAGQEDDRFTSAAAILNVGRRDETDVTSQQANMTSLFITRKRHLAVTISYHVLITGDVRLLQMIQII